MWSLKTGKVVVLGAIFGLIVSAVHVSSLIAARQDGLKAASHCGICTMAGQVAIEFARLEQKTAAITSAALSGIEDVHLRYDVLSDRVQAFDSADFRDFTDRDPASATTLRQLGSAMGRLRPLLDHIERPGAVEAALSLMAPLDFDLSRLASAAERYGAERTAAGQAELERLHRIFSRVVVALFVFGAGLLLLVAWHNRQLGFARDSLRILADDLRGTSARLEVANSEVTVVNAQLQERNAILDRRDREMGLQNKRFDAALNTMSVALCIVDAGDRLVVYNRGFAELFGLAFAPIPGILFSDLPTLAASPRLGRVYARQRALAAAGGDSGFVQEVADGHAEHRTLSVSHRPMSAGGWVATYEDVTHRRQAEARIAYLARHDPLTRLVNRAAFAEQLGTALAEAARKDGRVAVHCLGLDGFRDVNDAFGHGTGDALLREAGARLAAEAPGSVVARLGGDEFAVLQVGPAGTAEVEALATRLLRAMAEPFALADVELSVSASAGHATGLADGGSADDLMKNANLALAAAKLDGGGVARAFAPDMDALRRARRTLEGDLRRALPNGEFEAFFQPLVDARRLVVTGFEALLRWRHPARGLVPPSDFIPVAEEIGLIAQIGEWVLREACAQAALWPGDLSVAVNLSPAQFGAMDLIHTVDDALARSGLRPARLELEITESVLLGNDDGTLAVLHALRARGIRVAMDDFGTGYSSLSYLRRFPFDKIKIDQSFVRDLPSRPDCIKIVRSITALGASLGMTTVAEGVETAEQLEQLRAAGCDQVQGFHFGRPQPADGLTFALGPEFVAPAAEAA